MKLTTRCPACKTAFKVVPDQLKISSGWVRCGRCAEVFDAGTNLVTDGATYAYDDIKKSVPPKGLPQRKDSPKINIQVSPHRDDYPKTEKIKLQHFETPAKTDTDALIRSTQNKISTEKDVQDFDFVKDANRKAFWQQTSTIRMTILSLFVFSLLLVLQVAYDQRNHLAANSTGWHRLLTTACEHVNCTIQPDMQIDALKIDSSSFQKVQSTSDGEISELKVSIKNNALSPVAAPALELSLTDVNDRAVIKRVLSIEELGIKEPIIPALNESQISVRLLIKPLHATHTDKLQITGYRVLAFYP